MKRNTFAIIFLFACYYLTGETTHLSGNIDISLKENTLSIDLILSNYEVNKNTITFALNDIYKKPIVTLNNQPIEVNKSNEKCSGCHYYEISVQEGINSTDKIAIRTQGQFAAFNAEEYPSDYKGLIAKTSGILRASEQTVWYPVLLSDDNNQSKLFPKYLYTYDFKANCDCQNIYIGDWKVDKSVGRFHSANPLDNIMLIAGNYSSHTGKEANYINIPDEKQRKALEKSIANIKQYYHQISGKEITTKFTIASIPSGRKGWGGFLTYPTIVFTKKDVKNNMITKSLMSHEIAHYFFSHYYKPNSTLYWFYLESFAEYYSLKYSKEYIPLTFKYRFYKLKKRKKHFVRLDKVRKRKDINSVHYYRIAPLQLMLVEQQIGNSKMQELIEVVFTKIKSNENGYLAFISSLQEIGVEQKKIKFIENEIFKKFNLPLYKTLK